MKKALNNETCFRIVFVFLTGTAFLLLAWQCTERPPGPSRVDWPANVSAKP